MPQADAYLALVVPILLGDRPPQEEWGSGPTPWPVPQSPGNPHPGDAKVSDASERETMLGPRGRVLLHGDGNRWHRQVDPDLVTRLEGVFGLEVLAEPSLEGGTSGALLLVHAHAVVDDPVQWVSDQVTAARWIDVADLSAWGVDGETRRARVRHVVHVAPTASGDHPAWYPAAPRSWPADVRTMFHLAAASTPLRFPVFDSLESLPAEPMRLSEDWSAMVLRDGMSFLHHRDTSASGFFPTGRLLVQSVYLDVFALAQLQLRSATTLADGVSDLMASTPDAEAASKVEAELLHFRSRVWWRHLGDRDQRINELLRRAQDQHRIPALVDEITSELSDVARFVEAREARAREDDARRRDDVLRRRESTLQMIAIASALFFPASLVFTVGATWGDPSPALFAWLLGISAVMSVVALVLLTRYLREQRQLDVAASGGSGEAEDAGDREGGVA